MTAPVNDLAWRGASTVQAARNALSLNVDVELRLPATYHHAVCRHLRKTAAAQVSESLDLRGGAELLARLADVHGLEQIAELELPAARARAQVRIVSPSPTISIRCAPLECRS